MKSHKLLVVSLTLGLLAILTPTALSAKSKVYNYTNDDIHVYWTAAGCAGLVPRKCADPETTRNGQGNVATVCAKKKANVGEEVTYAFKDGTSNRRVEVYSCSSDFEKSNKSNVDNTPTGNKGEKHRCVVKKDSKNNSNKVHVKCGYNQTDYQAIKN